MYRAVAFSGTLDGMSPRQAKQLINFLVTECGLSTEFHHGGAIGADEQAHQLAKEVKCQLHVHLGHDSKGLAPKRSLICGHVFKVYASKPYLERNHDIVDAAEVLVAAPLRLEESLRSGTWATIRYAKKSKKKVILLKR